VQVEKTFVRHRLGCQAKRFLVGLTSDGIARER
jgi:hypothetical protein